MTKDVFIRDVMVKPATIAKSAKITEALDKMLAEGIDPLIAVNNNSVVGTVSRHAIAEKLGSRQNSVSPGAIHVASVVEEDFTSVYPDESINVLIPLLQRYKLVVVYDADHKLIGQVTAGDLLKKFPPADGLDPAIDESRDHRGGRAGRPPQAEDARRQYHPVRGLREREVHRHRDRDRCRHRDAQVPGVGDGQPPGPRIRNMLVKDIMSTPLLSVERTAPVSDVVGMMLRKNIKLGPRHDKGNSSGSSPASRWWPRSNLPSLFFNNTLLTVSKKISDALLLT